MKIICDSCGAKYSIADEKVAGKVFKIRCKKCSNMIVVRDGAKEAAPAQSSTPSINPTAAVASPLGALEASASHAHAAQRTPSVHPTVATASAYVAPGQPDPAAEPIWHVVVAGDQQGPYAPAQLGEMMTVGTIDWEAYVWREGFDGWVPARDIPELVEAITGQPYDPSYSSAAGDGDFAQPAAHAAAAADPFGDMEAGGAFDGTNVAASPFADGFGDDFGGNDDFGARHDSQQPTMAVSSEEIGGFGASPDVAMRAANSNAGGDLFGGGRNDMGAAFGGGAAPTSMPDQTSMTGQRNENSVLFSLANLQALATESSSASVRPEAKAGHAQGDGSGLIDIRALAAATGMGASAPAPALGGVPSFSAGPASERPKEDQLDNLMSIGTGSPLAMGALGAPVLTPAKDDSKKLIYVIAALGAALLLVVGVGVVYLMTRDSGTEVAAAAPPIAPPTNAGAEGTAATAGAAPAEATGGAAAPSAAAPAASDSTGSAAPSDEPSRDSARSDSSRSSGSRRTSHSGGGSSASSAPAAAPAPAPAPAPRRGGSDSIDDLLDNAIGGSGGSSKAASRSSGGGGGSDDGLPDTPSRDAVSSALRSVAGAVKGCGGGKSGLAMTKVVVAGSGRVMNAEVVSGPFKGTPEGSCIAREVRKAQFPRFKRDNMTVTFPYTL